MSIQLTPTITDVGMAAAAQADGGSIQITITEIGLGTAAYAPAPTATALQAEVRRVPIADGVDMGSALHLTALEDGATEYWVREVGFFLADGTLFAAWSDSDTPLAYHAAGVDLLLAFDLDLSAVPAGSVTVAGTGADLALSVTAELAEMATAIVAGQQAQFVHHLRLRALGG